MDVLFWVAVVLLGAYCAAFCWIEVGGLIISYLEDIGMNKRKDGER